VTVPGNKGRSGGMCPVGNPCTFLLAVRTSGFGTSRWPADGSLDHSDCYGLAARRLSAHRPYTEADIPTSVMADGRRALKMVRSRVNSDRQVEMLEGSV
jgi:hypothetical protein